MSVAEHPDISFLRPDDRPLERAPKPTTVAPVADLICGSIGGFACVLAGQPFDTVKTRLQAAPHVYRTIPTCMKKTLLEGGIRPFYHGATPAFTSNVVENAALFLFYGQCQRLVQWIGGGKGSEQALSVHQRGLAGSLASVFSSVLISPLEMFKCRLQVHRQMGAWNMIHQIYKEEGWRGYFRGLTSTWAREIPGYYCFFLTYEAARRWMAKPEEQSVESLEGYKVVLAGGLAGCGFWAVAYPLDSVKSRIQVKVVESGSLVRVALQMFRNEGVQSFYKGLLSALIRSFPSNAALFLAYEASKRQLTKLTGSTCAVQ